MILVEDSGNSEDEKAVLESNNSSEEKSDDIAGETSTKAIPSFQERSELLVRSNDFEDDGNDQEGPLSSVESSDCGEREDYNDVAKLSYLKVWRSRCFLIIAGCLCALLILALWRILVHSPDDHENELEIAAVIKVQNQEEHLQNTVFLQQDEHLEGESAEEELGEIDDLVLIRSTDADFLDNKEFDTRGVDIAEEFDDADSGLNSSVSMDSLKSSTPGDEKNELVGGESVNIIENDTVGPGEEAFENRDHIDSSADDEAVVQQIISSDEEDEADSIPTDFNEVEFEKANKNETPNSLDDEEVDLGAIASTTEVTIRAFPTLKREPKSFDINERLGLKIKMIEFPESPAGSVRLLSEFSGIPIDFDLVSFDLLRQSVDSTMNLSLEETSVKDSLLAMADLLKWNVSIGKDRITIKSFDNLDDLIEERFDVADLIEIESEQPLSDGLGSLEKIEMSMDLLQRMIVSLVDPESWSDNGGIGEIGFENNLLIIKHNALIRKRVGDLLERLRALHGIKNKGQIIDASSLIPETLGWKRLTKKISFNLLEPSTLQQAIEIIERSQKIEILWNDSVLNEFGVGRDFSIIARINDASIDQVLNDLLESAKLTYLILGENLFLITTKELAEIYKTIEIHMFLSEGERATEEELYKMIEEMKLAVDSKSWDEPSVALWVDWKSGCWIVRQSQPNQRAIRRWLEERR